MNEPRSIADLARALARAHNPTAILHAVRSEAVAAVRLWVTRSNDDVLVDAERNAMTAPEWITRSARSRIAHHRDAVALALADENGVTGVLELEGPFPWPADRLADVAAVLTLAMRHTITVARIASQSRRAHETAAAVRETLEATQSGPALIARSPAMRSIVFEQLPLVARRDTTVLLRGETGTGKELLARRIHALSRRADRPFLAVNCGALPATLLESVLFGHERGAFTGATSRHAGVFERAHGGTILLDEIGELSLDAQTRLLRVLQEGRLERVGGTRAIDVNVRVIAATHRPLERWVADERFRADLFYRLDVFRIAIPPLRERRDDIEPLVQAILESLATPFERSVPRVTPEDIATLQQRDWPGNVRELANVLERAMVLCTGDVLKIGGESSGVSPAPITEPTEAHASRSWDDAMRVAAERALRETRGQIHGARGAAAMLGLKPTTLVSRLKKLGIDPARFR